MTWIRYGVVLAVWIVVGETLAQRAGGEADERRELQGEAQTDPLTGLGNRRALENALATLPAGEMSVVMIDLDHFKALNDRDGHAAGDCVLAHFGTLLRDALRGQDIAVRYGGEEFLLLLVDTSPEGAVEVLARMRGQWALMEPGVTFSAGVAAFHAASGAQRAISSADVAL